MASHAQVDFTRRSLVLALASTPMLSALPTHKANASAPEPASSCIAPSERYPFPVIDAHCHIFNGVDVPVRQFVQAESVNGGYGNALGYLAGLVVRVATRKGSLGTDVEIREIIDSIDQQQSSLCAVYEEKERVKMFGMFDIKSARGFNDYRLFNAIRLLKTFPEVDLFTPAMVDLYTGMGPARFNIKYQAEVYSRICALLGGRLLPFIAFDPLREAEYRLGFKPKKGKYEVFSQFEIVKSAIANHGFIGVKLYPPMGFSPSRENERLACTRGFLSYITSEVPHGENIRKPLKDGRSIAATMDDALDDLYGWCAENGVPIMAHANDSMYANAKCANRSGSLDHRLDLGHPEQWASVASDHPGLHVNMGHFGGVITQDGRGMSPRAESIAAVISRHNNLYADISNLTNIHDGNSDQAKRTIESMFKDHRKLSSHLMYGSDWFMSESESLKNYYGLIKAAIPEDRFRDIYSRNTIKFLMLAKGDRNRERVSAFLSSKNVPQPRWMRLTGSEGVG